MTHLVITRWDADGRINKYQDRLTLSEANAVQAKLVGTAEKPGAFPQAFTVAHPTGGEELSNIRDYIADPVAKTITLNVLPLTKEQINNPIRAEIVAKERLTDRRVREMVLRWAQAALPVNDADRVALEAREAEFAALRAQLVP